MKFPLTRNAEASYGGWGGGDGVRFRHYWGTGLDEDAAHVAVEFSARGGGDDAFMAQLEAHLAPSL